jgi:phage baseplate assembly protein W
VSDRPDFAGRGWAFPMGADPTGGIALVSGEENLIKAMRLILSTYPGERPMRPEFGSRLRDYIFRGIDGPTVADLANEVQSALLRWEPRVDVERVEVVPDPEDDTLVYIDIYYVARATNDRRNLVFPFYTIPEEPPEELPAEAGE